VCVNAGYLCNLLVWFGIVSMGCQCHFSVCLFSAFVNECGGCWCSLVAPFVVVVCQCLLSVHLVMCRLLAQFGGMDFQCSIAGVGCWCFSQCSPSLWFLDVSVGAVLFLWINCCGAVVSAATVWFFITFVVVWYWCRMPMLFL